MLLGLEMTMALIYRKFFVFLLQKNLWLKPYSRHYLHDLLKTLGLQLLALMLLHDLLRGWKRNLEESKGTSWWTATSTMMSQTISTATATEDYDLLCWHILSTEVIDPCIVAYDRLKWVGLQLSNCSNSYQNLEMDGECMLVKVRLPMANWRSHLRCSV